MNDDPLRAFKAILIAIPLGILLWILIISCSVAIYRLLS